MRDTIIWRGMVVLLSSGALACATGEEGREESAVAVPPADTAALAVPQAAESTGETTAATPPAVPPAATAPAPAAPIGTASAARGSIRAVDTVKGRRGHDRAITPDFSDPSKRLPPAPDSSSSPR